MSAPISGTLSASAQLQGQPSAAYSNTDTLLGPVLAGLANVAAQVQGIGTIYTEVPEQTPQDNSVMFPVKSWKVVDWTDGTAQIEWTIDVIHIFVMSRFQDDLSRAQTFIAPWLYALSSLTNTTLAGAAVVTEVQGGQFIQYVHSGQPYLALVSTVRVVTEYILPR